MKQMILFIIIIIVLIVNPVLQSQNTANILHKNKLRLYNQKFLFVFMAEKFINGLDFQINFKNTELFVQYF